MHLLKEPVNVSAVFRCFKGHSKKQMGWEHKRIEPRGIERKNGEHLSIAEIRRSYPQRKGGNIQVHFVVRTKDDRYFHLVYESQKMLWILLYEFEEQMLFDEMEVEVRVNWNSRSDT